MYHKKRSMLDKFILWVVVIIAIVVISLSFHNTSILAQELGLNSYLTAGLVEILFASLLFIRGRQRATQRHVPLFLSAGYYTSFIFVTGVNMWGLSQSNSLIGPIVGLAISGAMWLMENTLVWLWTESDQPHKKSVKELMKEAQREIQEEKVIQRIEWMKWEAKKPDLKLIKEARKAEEKRKEIIGDGLPEFFLQQPDPVGELVAELKEAEPKTVDIQEKTDTEPEPVQTVEVAPMRQIGFHVEAPKPKPPAPKPGPAPLFQPNLKARENAIETAKQLKEKLGRLPKKRELIEKGLTDHYARIALSELKNQ